MSLREIDLSNGKDRTVLFCYSKFVYELQPGEDWRLWNGVVLIAGGDKPPRLIHEDGSIEEIKPA